MKIKGVVEDLKIKKKKNENDHKNSKTISRTFSGVVVGIVGSVHFGQFLGPAYISLDLQAPSYVVDTNDRVLIYCTCHFQGGSLCFSFFCLLVSSVSNFCPDTRGQWWTLFQTHLFSCAVGSEGRCKQITLACARSASATLGLPLLMAPVPSLPTLLRLQVASPGTVRGWPWAACTSQI